jgi:hypothetical protein
MTSRRRIVGGLAAALILALVGVAIARNGNGGNHKAATTTTTATPTSTSPPSSTAPATTPPTTGAPPPVVTVAPTTCCSQGTAPTTTTVATSPTTPIGRPEEFTGSLDMSAPLPVDTSVAWVGEDLQIQVLVRNGSDHAFVIGDPTGRGAHVSVSLVCSHLDGLANWSLPVVGFGTRWPPDDNTGIISHETVRASDIGNMTCRAAFVRGGSTPTFDPVSHAMISHDVTIVAPLPNIPAVHRVVVATRPVSTSTTTAPPTTTIARG